MTPAPVAAGRPEPPAGSSAAVPLAVLFSSALYAWFLCGWQPDSAPDGAPPARAEGPRAGSDGGLAPLPVLGATPSGPTHLWPVPLARAPQHHGTDGPPAAESNRPRALDLREVPHGPAGRGPSDRGQPPVGGERPQTVPDASNPPAPVEVEGKAVQGDDAAQVPEPNPGPPVRVEPRASLQHGGQVQRAGTETFPAASENVPTPALGRSIPRPARGTAASAEAPLAGGQVHAPESTPAEQPGGRGLLPAGDTDRRGQPEGLGLAADDPVNTCQHGAERAPHLARALGTGFGEATPEERRAPLDRDRSPDGREGVQQPPPRAAGGGAGEPDHAAPARHHGPASEQRDPPSGGSRLRLEVEDARGDVVHVDVRTRSEAVWARVEAGPEVAQLLRAQAPALQRALGAQGLTLAGLDVGTLPQGGGRAQPQAEPAVLWRPRTPRRAVAPARTSGAVDYVV